MKPAELPQWLLERIALDELPRPLPDSTRRRIEGTPPSPPALAQIAQANAGFLRQHPPGLFFAQLEARETQRATPRHAGWLGRALAMSAAAVAMLLVLVRVAPTTTEPEERIKGVAPTLTVYLRQPEGALRLPDGAGVHAGDVVQLRYRAAGRSYGVILSVDGAGKVTLHWPSDAATPARLRNSSEVALPSGYQLDAAPKFERFLFVTSERPLQAQALLESVRIWATEGFPSNGPKLPAGTQISSLTLFKEVP
ncbi:MAG: ActD-like protein [Myxococcaceae bacterium]